MLMEVVECISTSWYWISGYTHYWLWRPWRFNRREYLFCVWISKGRKSVFVWYWQLDWQHFRMCFSSFSFRHQSWRHVVSETKWRAAYSQLTYHQIERPKPKVEWLIPPSQPTDIVCLHCQGVHRKSTEIMTCVGIMKTRKSWDTTTCVQFPDNFISPVRLTLY